ncbi:uncharacterized protein BDW43DRAFT_208770 [Aspergillus alliaceus]|uniref:uncharacterized protein n=1 Tax=Petromyces alliaceus TaxID=209559 RepID=UPI0012A50176|nr:uncharacterized protein BDW43DRAFT_208770 [Aspergillus alliaceus]KAB8228835.1 hypothetical protein BDW43DRAFT_208770 [Aspergillus alliaceus]
METLTGLDTCGYASAGSKFATDCLVKKKKKKKKTALSLSPVAQWASAKAQTLAKTCSGQYDEISRVRTCYAHDILLCAKGQAATLSILAVAPSKAPTVKCSTLPLGWLSASPPLLYHFAIPPPHTTPVATGLTGAGPRFHPTYISRTTSLELYKF